MAIAQRISWGLRHTNVEPTTRSKFLLQLATGRKQLAKSRFLSEYSVNKHDSTKILYRHLLSLVTFFPQSMNQYGPALMHIMSELLITLHIRRSLASRIKWSGSQTLVGTEETIPEGRENCSRDASCSPSSMHWLTIGGQGQEECSAILPRSGDELFAVIVSRREHGVVFLRKGAIEAVQTSQRESSASSSCCPSPNRTVVPDAGLSSGDERFADLIAKITRECQLWVVRLARRGDNRDISHLSQSCAGDAARSWCGFVSESGALTRRPVEADYRTGAKNTGRWLLTARNSASGEQKDLSADAMPFV
ncbi:hypothetical protein V8E53_000650 [Lactarius tabidus]